MTQGKGSSKRINYSRPEPTKISKARNLPGLLAEGEADIAAGKTRTIRAFLREFKKRFRIWISESGEKDFDDIGRS